MNALGPEARALLDHGRHADEATAAQKARARQRFSATLAAGAAASTATAGSRASGGASGTAATAQLVSATGAKWLLGTVLLLGAGGIFRFLSSPSPQLIEVVLVDAPTAEALPSESGSEVAPTPAFDESTPSTALTAQPISGPPADPEERRAVASGRRPAPVKAKRAPRGVTPELSVPGSVPRAAPSVSSARPSALARAPEPERTRRGAPVLRLAREASLLKKAQRSLDSGQLRRVEADLATYDREFARGALRAERDALFILVQCRRSGAKSVAALVRKFHQAHPKSPLRARLAECE